MLLLRSLPLSLLSLASAHVCLLHPVQRGGFDVHDAGDNSCFQPNACTAPVEAPAITLAGGSAHHVLLQQNLNHYEPGWPGVIDISIATLSEAAGGNWSILATIPDYFAHLQAAQTNFTVPVLLPAGASAHSVLRVRYDPHKPTEVIFHQCADVAISAAPAPPAPGGAVLALASPGAPLSSSSLAVAVAELAPSGAVRIVAAPPAGAQLLAGVSASLGGALYTLARAGGGGGAAPATLLVRATAGGGGAPAAAVPIRLPPGDAAPPLQWVALAALPQQQLLLLVGLRAGSKAGTFVFQARTLATSGEASAVLAQSADQDTFLNVMQLTNGVPAAGGGSTAYLLAGDENSLYALRASLFTIPIGGGAPPQPPAAMTAALLDDARYTFSNVHASGGRLLAVSPGLYGIGNSSAADWALVQVAPDTGAVSRVAAIAGGAKGLFAPWYGGAVYGDEPAAGATLLHLFRHAVDDSFALATIDTATGELAAVPTLMNGVNGELLFDTPVFVAGA